MQHSVPAGTAAAQSESAATENAAAEDSLREASGLTGSTILLFKTPTCPNCKAAGALLDRAGVDYEPLNANEEKELVGRYGVKQAPTLVLIDHDGFVKFKGVSEIKGWLMNR
jgi:ribonucleoside-triphosphate reductase